MIKTIIFCIGVDVLGFPKYHEHRLVFKEKRHNKIPEGKYIIGFDPYLPNGGGKVTMYNRKHLDK